MNDLISRQALMKEFADFVKRSNNSDFASTPTWNDAVSLVGSMPSAEPSHENCWGCNCPKMEGLNKQKTFSEMVHLHDTQTADVVEVVRCRECKHYQGSCCDYSAVYIRPNGYCQWGERR